MHFYKALLPFKAISFDLDDTLYDNGPVIEQAEQAMQQRLLQLAPQLGPVDAEFWWLKRKELADQMNKGGNDQNLGTAIRQIDQQITALEKQLQQLVRENELAKNNPDDDNRREWSAQSLGQSA